MTKGLCYFDYLDVREWAGFILDSETGESQVLRPEEYDAARAAGMRRSYFSDDEHETAEYGIFSLHDVLDPESGRSIEWPDGWCSTYVKLVCAIIESAWTRHHATRKAKHTRKAHTRKTHGSGVVDVKTADVGDTEDIHLAIYAGDVCAYLDTADKDAWEKEFRTLNPES